MAQCNFLLLSLYAHLQTRGLPADHQGPVRVINIGTSGRTMIADSNMCCGTHVSNLSELQMVKLLNVGPSKRKGFCLGMVL